MRFNSSVSAHSEPSTDCILAIGQVRAMIYATLAVSELPGCKSEGRRANLNGLMPNDSKTYLLTFDVGIIER